jgi:hypothetical protein
MTDDRFIQPGTKVRYDGTGQSEFGVVVHSWMNPEICGHDCYVAFFGNSFPTDAPAEKPYVLRYASVSLTVLD